MGSLEERIKENTSKAMQFPVSVQFAISQVMPNTINGAYWSFTSMETVSSYVEEISGDSNLSVKRIGARDCLVEVNPEYLLKALNLIDPELFGLKELDTIKVKMKEARDEIVKFLLKRGKNGEGAAAVIGVYCINNVASITSKGTNYPAFRLPLSVVLQYLSLMKYSIMVEGKYINPDVASSMGQRLYDSCRLSPTKTGVFISIKAEESAEWYRQKAEFLRVKKAPQ